MATILAKDEFELDGFRMVIEERSGICFDDSRERFFSSRIQEYLQERKLASGADLMKRL